MFVVSRLAIPEMKKRGGGVILHIAARSGMLGQAGRAAYCASKGGMVTLTEAMAMDHAQDKIRVNCICPGPTRTPMVDTSTPEKLARYKTRVPIGRIGEPEDVAYAARVSRFRRGFDGDGGDLAGGRRHAADSGHERSG